MADVLSQSLSIQRGSDVSIVLTGAASDFSQDPTLWSLQFSIAKNRGQTPIITVTTPTIAITGTGPYVATIPLTRAQTSALDRDEYDWDLWRTDPGLESPKAGGTLQIITPVFPPVAVV